MQTKSNIQLIQEALKIKENFKSSIDNLMSKYLVEDSVFAHRNGNLYECTKGYFEVDTEFDNLDEAIKCWNPMLCLRVVGNQKFQIGEVKKFLTECKEDKQVFDINSLVDVR